MEQYQAEQVAQTGQRINDPIQAQQIYSKLSNNAQLRMAFLANHADILANGVSFGGLSYQQDQEIEQAKIEAEKAQHEADMKAYEQFKAQQAHTEQTDFWAKLGMPNNTIQGGR